MSGNIKDKLTARNNTGKTTPAVTSSMAVGLHNFRHKRSTETSSRFLNLHDHDVRNRIVGLHNAAGNWITEDSWVEKVAVEYFDELFTTTSPSDLDGFLDEVRSSITHEMNQRLLRVVTEDEVRQALFMMHPEKIPGPDGMTALFF